MTESLAKKLYKYKTTTKKTFDDPIIIIEHKKINVNIDERFK